MPKLKSIDFLFALLILSLVIIYFNFYSLNVDSTWILNSARNLVLGSKMYVDIIDVNPPLIFIYSTLAIFISQLSSFNTINSFILLVLFLIGISSILSWYVIKNIKFNIKEAKRYFIYAVITILTISITYNFGQREHLFMIFIFPYLLFKIYGKYNQELAFPIRSLIGIFAALGFNLKPHFFLIFVTIELLHIIDRKSISNFLKIDSVIIVSSSFFYFLIIYYFFPEYINFIIPFALETYVDVFNKSFYTLIINYEFIFFTLTILIFVFFIKEKLSLSTKTILVAIISSFIIYLLQQKGWSYHRVPFFMISLLFLIHLIIYKSNSKSIYFIFLVPFICMVSYYNLINVYQYNDLKKILNQLPSNSSVLIVSMDIAEGQPLLKEHQVWASRFPSFFMMPSVFKNNNSKIKKYTFDSIYEDLIKYKPNYIIFPNKFKSYNIYNYLTKEDIKLKDFYTKYYKMTFNKNYLILVKEKDY